MELMTPLCPVCGDPAESDFRPCPACRGRIERSHDGTCAVCGRDLAGGRGPCTSCREFPEDRALSRMEALGDWQGPLREWLSMYKYGGDVRLADYLGEMLASVLNRRWPDIPVVPVPPRPLRMRREGFDPVGVLADSLEKKGIPVSRLLVRRGRSTQKGLGRSERLSRGSLDFRIRRTVTSIEGPLVILDDVSTTGATLETCASVLRESGASEVFGVVVCRD